MLYDCLIPRNEAQAIPKEKSRNLNSPDRSGILAFFGEDRNG